MLTMGIRRTCIILRLIRSWFEAVLALAILQSCAQGSKKGRFGSKMTKHGRVADVPKWVQNDPQWSICHIFYHFGLIWTLLVHIRQNLILASKIQVLLGQNDLEPVCIWSDIFQALSSKLQIVRGIEIFYGPSNSYDNKPFNFDWLRGGGLQSLFQYYSSERKMECYNPFSALNKVKSHHFILLNLNLWLRILSQNMKSAVNTCF